MKKIMLLSLVFMTTFLRGQNVDPETFPALNSGIGSKYLYTNTGGEGKILVDDIIVGSIDTVAVTYSEFYSLITSNQLIGGNTYILMDFQTVYDQMDFDNSGNLKPTLVTKTGAIEQIWVLALSSNQIADKAYSATYPNDEIQYDWTYTTTLVNGAPAKGRITERIDEWNNRTDYDHREIKFIRYDDGAGNFVIINDNGNASQEFLTFGNNYGAGGIIHDNWLGDFYSIGQLFGQEYSNNVLSANLIVNNKLSALCYNNSFGYNSTQIFNCNFSGNLYNSIFFRNIWNTSIASDFGGNIIHSDMYNSSFLNSNTEGNVFFKEVEGLTCFGDLDGNMFNCLISYVYLYSQFDANIINSNNGLTNVFISQLDNKTLDDTTYPFLFGTNYEKRIFKASDGNVYARYFDGTNDVNTLIP